MGRLTLLSLAVVLLTSPAARAAETAAKPVADLAVGRQAYETNCARCHGTTGAGDGRDALLMVPRPRPLADGVFKFRTTASGTPPTDEDLYRTLSRGLPGSRMPDFQRLPEETRWQLVYYVKSLSPVFGETVPEPVALGTDPGPEGADLARGKAAYAKLGCASCHGDQGRGNGPSAQMLQDDWGQPMQAADLTQGWRYRGGNAAKDILTRLLTGLDGTPMPSYVEATTPEEAWHLAYYVQSLQEEPRFERSIQAVRVEGALPSDPSDPRWQQVPRTDLMLSSSFYQDQKLFETAVHAISAQALYNEEGVAFRLRWHDRSESRGNPADAVSMALLGDRKRKWKVGSLRSWPADPEAAPLHLLSWSAADGEATETVARGLPRQEGVPETPSRRIAAASTYEDGEWLLVFSRPLEGALDGAVTLQSGETALLGLMVWDGGNDEQGRRHASSNWVDLKLE